MSLIACWLYRAPVVVLALLFPTLALAQTYVGPCDVAGVTCAEAWGVDYAMTRNYAGPLFQILRASDKATLDIGQDPATHKADMTTWSAFCQDDPNNCLYIKLYAQIHRHVNDLAPVGYVSQGQTKLSIDGTTNLPILNSNHGCCGGAYARFDVGGTDAALTGVPGGENPASIIYLGEPFQETSCCGQFLLSHTLPPTRDVNGTDFGLALGYGCWNGGCSGININCATTTSFCLASDEEGNADGPPYDDGNNTSYSDTRWPNAFAAVTFDPATKRVSGFINGGITWSISPSIVYHCSGCTLSPGNHLHLGMGGDGSNPAKVVAREMIITNATLTFSQYQAMFANVKARYPTLLFPGPPAPSK